MEPFLLTAQAELTLFSVKRGPELLQNSVVGFAHSWLIEIAGKRGERDLER
jgi:hypothetical protein